MTLVAGDSDHFLLFTATLRTFICEYLERKKQVSISFIIPSHKKGKKNTPILTFLFRCAGSDLQSRSMCSPTLISGISPRLMGIGMLHNGHTGTWISYKKKNWTSHESCYSTRGKINDLHNASALVATQHLTHTQYFHSNKHKLN